MHIDHDSVELKNEADVEFKIILPLLQGAAYLDIPEIAVKPKKYLAPTPFNRKAGHTSGSYPDFSVWFRSFPCLIVEAKAPDVSVEVAYHEAQLYASYLNQNYPTGINPAYFVLGTNGVDYCAGYWNSKPTLKSKQKSAFYDASSEETHRETTGVRRDELARQTGRKQSRCSGCGKATLQKGANQKTRGLGLAFSI